MRDTYGRCTCGRLFVGGILAGRTPGHLSVCTYTTKVLTCAVCGWPEHAELGGPTPLGFACRECSEDKLRGERRVIRGAA